ncbi:hypothetical protein TNCV_3268061 [Trichonephila clavipes]|nr:hypothetical protein TNCV_3268061 [Trichonephila clavipes]
MEKDQVEIHTYKASSHSSKSTATYLAKNKSETGMKQINLEAGSDDVQKLLSSHNQELTMDELIEMHEQEQDIEELEFLEPFQAEDRMTIGNLTERLLFN